ncbi:MAG: hypothetical protein VB092_01895 [Oscillospiraceae bacterium]|nr:hypothetical protein [Oscillospiraceae bacterium]
MDEIKPNGNNFMAAMRVDALKIAPLVFDYLKAVRGFDFDSLMLLRQPDDPERKRYWRVLQKAVNALCRKRYSRSCVEDRRTMMLESITNHTMRIWRMCGRAMTGCGMRPAKSYPRWPPFNSIRAASLYRARRPFLYKS